MDYAKLLAKNVAPFMHLVDKVIPLMLGAFIGGFVFYKLDDKYDFTQKVRNAFKISPTWEPFVYLSAGIILSLIIRILITTWDDIIYGIIEGIPLGIAIYIGNKNSRNINKS